MFRNPIALEFAKHGQLRMSEDVDYRFMAGEAFVPFVLDETAEIAREYPIVFPVNQGDIPFAVIALQPGHTAYLDEKGRWLARYVPASVRSYPFRFGRIPAKEPGANDRRVVLLDPDAPHFRGTGGDVLFTAGGKLSTPVARRMVLLEAMERSLARTQHVVRAIAAEGLLVEAPIHIKTGAGTGHRITGVRVVDEERLNGLSDQSAGALCRVGAFRLIHAHLLSRVNFRLGPLASKSSPMDVDAGIEPGGGFFGDTATIDFSSLS